MWTTKTVNKLITWREKFQINVQGYYTFWGRLLSFEASVRCEEYIWISVHKWASSLDCCCKAVAGGVKRGPNNELSSRELEPEITRQPRINPRKSTIQAVPPAGPSLQSYHIVWERHMFTQLVLLYLVDISSKTLPIFYTYPDTTHTLITVYLTTDKS